MHRVTVRQCCCTLHYVLRDPQLRMQASGHILILDMTEISEGDLGNQFIGEEGSDAKIITVSGSS